MTHIKTPIQTFERLESEVRSYCRSFPVVFREAREHLLIDEDGNEYIDFFAGAGALNYGHNDWRLKKALLEYLANDGVTHSLDLFTTAKGALLESLEARVLKPRGLEYRVMFPGPTGTNAVESALKIARKATGRTHVVSFTNGFHGMTLGSLSVTGNAQKRGGAQVSLSDATALPFDGYLGDDVDTLDLLERMLLDCSSGLDKPAAVIFETVQAEGGVNVARVEWLQRLHAICREHGVLTICDDIQVGCGRTGPFFSFERAGVTPDLVTLSKSLSGYGTPLALVLIRPDLDCFEPGEHNGTFRGHNLAFVTATAALETYWADDKLSKQVEESAIYARSRFATMTERHAALGLSWRGLGMIQGIVFDDPKQAGEASKAAFERGLIMETAGPRGEVLKLLPPLTIAREALAKGLSIVDAALGTLSPAASQSSRRRVSITEPAVHA